MQPTYHDGDLILFLRAYRKPKTGDVVLVQKDGKLLIKRVAAVEGETATLEATPSGYNEQTFDDGTVIRKPEYHLGRNDEVGQYVFYDELDNWFNFLHLERSYTHWCTYYYWGTYEHPQIPENYVFVAGDNLKNSEDSRKMEFGLINIQDIWGYAFWTIRN